MCQSLQSHWKAREDEAAAHKDRVASACSQSWASVGPEGVDEAY